MCVKYVLMDVWQRAFLCLHSCLSALPSFRTWLQDARIRTSADFLASLKYTHLFKFHVCIVPSWSIRFSLFHHIWFLICSNVHLILSAQIGSSRDSGIASYHSKYFSPLFHSRYPSLTMWRINNVEDRKLILPARETHTPFPTQWKYSLLDAFGHAVESAFFNNDGTLTRSWNNTTLFFYILLFYQIV